MSETQEVSASKLLQLGRELSRARHNVNYFPADYTIEVLAQKYERREIEVPPYQRPLVWTPRLKSFFIESLLIRIPIPPLFLSDVAGKLEVVDGSQRLRTIASFLKGEFELESLDTLRAAVGLKFLQLPEEARLRLLSTPVRTYILNESTSSATRIDIFKRLNTGGQKLTDAQIRKGGFAGPFYSMVEQCAADPAFIEMTPMGQRKDASHEREELVLRYFAYSERYQAFRHDVGRFLDQYVEDKNNDASFDATAATENFKSTMDNIRLIFPHGFAKNSTSNITPRVRFEAIAVGVNLAMRESGLPASPDMSWLDSTDFEELTRSDASNSRTKLRDRIEYVRDRLLGR